MLDVLEKVPFEITEDGSNTTVQDTQDFIRNNALRSPPILLSDVIVPTLREGVCRSDLIK